MGFVTAAHLYERLGPDGYGMVARLAEWRGPDDMARVMDDTGVSLAGACALDVAIGTGQLSKLFRRACVGQIIGVDAAAENIDYCLKNKLADEGIVCDVAEWGLPLENGEAGVVTCSGLFSYLADPSFVAAEMAIVLKSGGVAAINFHPASGARIETEHLPAGSMGKADTVVEMYHHPIESVSGMFERAGLRRVQTHVNDNGIMRLHTGKRLPLATLAFVKG